MWALKVAKVMMDDQILEESMGEKGGTNCIQRANYKTLFGDTFATPLCGCDCASTGTFSLLCVLCVCAGTESHDLRHVSKIVLLSKCTRAGSYEQATRHALIKLSQHPCVNLIVRRFAYSLGVCFGSNLCNEHFSVSMLCT